MMARHAQDAYYRHVHPVLKIVSGFFATLLALSAGTLVEGDTRNTASVSRTEGPDPRLPFPGMIAIKEWPAAPSHGRPAVNRPVGHTAKRPVKVKRHIVPKLLRRTPPTTVKTVPVSVPVKKVPAERRAPTPFRTTRVAVLLTFLAAQVGKSYVFGGNGPNGYDCSGLTKAAYKRVGVDLPRTSQGQSLVGVPVLLTGLRPGDLLFWGIPGFATHVAVYVGGGRYIAAQNHSVGVIRYPLSFFPPDFATRIL